MIAVKIYIGEVRGKLDGNSNWFTTDNSKAVPLGRGLYYGWLSRAITWKLASRLIHGAITLCIE